MKTATVFLVILFSTINIQVMVGVLIEKPENTVVMLNETATIKCKSEDNEHLVWHMYGNTSDEVELWNGYNLNVRECPCECYEIDNHVFGKYYLNIDARKETAMRYKCTEPETLMRVSANLIVIASNLTCDYRMTEDEVTLSCVIEVYGEWLPLIRWNMSHGGKVNKAFVSVNNGKVISILTMPLTSHEIYYRARVHFSESGRPAEVTATNVPTYAAEWISEPLKLETKQVSHTRIVVAAVIVPCACAVGVPGVFVTAALVRNRKKSKAEDGSSTEEKKDFIKKQSICDEMKNQEKHQLGNSVNHSMQTV